MARKRVELAKLMVDGGEVDAKACGRCAEVKPLVDFHTSNHGPHGRVTNCKACAAEYARIYYEDNRERLSHVYRSYRERNAEKVASRKRAWGQRNPDKVGNAVARYKCRKQALPNSLTPEQECDILIDFGGRCALTGGTESVHIDHWIALSTGKGGTVRGNILPLCKSINSSKHTQNPFIWIARRPDISIERFNYAVQYLARQSGMGIDEFRRYTYECYDSIKDEAASE